MFKITASLLAGLVLMTTCASALGSEMRANPVRLSDANAAPTYVAILPSNAHADIPARCDGEVSAYTGTGGALGGQQWNTFGDRTYWRADHGRVMFDGVTFYNGTRAPKLVACWQGV